MGYRSDVAIGLKKEFVKDFEVIIKEDIERNWVQVEEHAGFNLYLWEDVKWYTGCFPVVNAVMDSLHDLDDEDYGYVRIGEEFSDIEVEGFYWEFSIDIHRQVVAGGLG